MHVSQSRFFERNVNMLTLSGFNFIRTGEAICPDELKRRSEGELVAQMHRNLLANTARDG